ncbi:hypothetical protein CPT03_12215 [Pedobacter ginsengisoli]|uniref:Uncharacterized protein n=1 Tax=Pedobacter ginsengisoli TaxID=363852 RepID=A0A2D1U6H0_9SPHI|nr:hypothetical protein CPT03_12215 [Pedobacter ginsengisoli]
MFFGLFFFAAWLLLLLTLALFLWIRRCIQIVAVKLKIFHADAIENLAYYLADEPPLWSTPVSAQKTVLSVHDREQGNNERIFYQLLKG